MWQVKPKFHLFIHLAEQQTVDTGDPSSFWACKDEDFVGFIGDIATSRGGQRVATTTPVNVCKRYRALARL